MKYFNSFLLCLACTSTILSQNVGINTNTPSYLLHIHGKESSSTSLFVNDTVSTGQRQAVTGRIQSTAPTSAAVSGYSFEAGSISPVESFTYALLGATGSATAIGGYALSGTAIRAKSNTGLALFTTGTVKLTGIGESAGKVLTSDALGNASWQSLPSSNHDHYGEAWSGGGSYGLQISNSGTAGTAMRVTAIGGSTSTGLLGSSYSASGFGVIGQNLSSSPQAPLINNAGVAGIAGSGIGVYAGSVSGTSLVAEKANYVGADGSVARFSNKKTGNNDAVVLIEAVQNQPALELSNGSIKVSGAYRPAFQHTTLAGNISGNVSKLSYANQQSTDIVIAVHNYSPTNTYLNKAYGVYWNGVNWCVYLEDGTPMPVNITFNILVIKQ